MATTTTYTNNGDGTATITIKSTANRDKIDLLAAEASEYLYYHVGDYQFFDDEGVSIPWDDLTNQRKLDILGRETVRRLKSCAYKLYVDNEHQTIKDNLDDSNDRYNDT